MTKVETKVSSLLKLAMVSQTGPSTANGYQYDCFLPVKPPSGYVWVATLAVNTNHWRWYMEGWSRQNASTLRVIIENHTGAAAVPTVTAWLLYARSEAVQVS